MPLLSYTAITDYPFQPFTKIYSSDINAMFAAIQTLLNTTKLDNTNIQNLGISATKLSPSGGSAGQFLANNGSAIVYVGSPLTSQYNVIIGSAANVSAGVATNSTFASWTPVSGDRVLLLPTYTGTENVTITASNILLVGLGASCIITGTLTLDTGSNESMVSGLRITDNMTINSNKCHADRMILASGKTFIDNGTSNLVEGIRE